MNMFLFRYLLIFSAVFLLSACVASQRFSLSDDYPDRRYPMSDIFTDNTDEKYSDYTVIDSLTGSASYYGREFHGRKTASGQIFDMYRLTAAHPDYPFNTVLRVTNLENNKSTIVIVNDRMPSHNKRVIDLSYGAAKMIQMIKSGTAIVRIQVLKWGPK